MGILLPAGVACMLFVIYGRMYKSGALSILATFVSMQAITVLIAEITSLLNAFSLYPLIIIWGTLFVVLCIKMRRSFNFAHEIKSVCGRWGKLPFPAKAFLMAIGLTAILVLLRAILYPPQNVDSLMYHLSRAALYYKNSTIHNFPAQYAWALYTGPLSAILMAQQMIFLHGSDFFCNLVQFPAWISASVAVYILARRLGANQNWAMLSMWIALSCPEAVLQGATTQTDLLAASCCVVTVALLVEGIKRKENITIWLLAGLAGGESILSKISSGIVLFPLLLWFLACLLKTQKHSQTKLRALAVLATSSLTMVMGFWIRNAIDLEGDFLALKLSASMSGIKQPIVNNLIGRVVVNIAYCMGGADCLWSEAIDRVSRKIYGLLGANEIPLEDITCYQVYISHDEQPYPLVMGLLIAGALAGAILFILSRKKNWFVIGYSLSAATSVVLLAMSIEPGISSISRYILGPVFIALPAVELSLQKFAEYLTKLTKYRYISILTAGGIVSVSLFTMVFVNLHDTRQPLLYKWYSYSRDELRNSPYAGLNWIEPGNEFMRIIDEMEITKVAVTEQVVGGYYPFIYMLRENKYEVKTIDMKYGSIHEDQQFEPEAIMMIHQGPNAPDIYERSGKVYYRSSNEHRLLFNNAYAALYVDEELLALKDQQSSFNNHYAKDVD